MKGEPKPRVLVVDDETRLLEALTRALESMGYEARGETNAAAAMEAISSWNPDVLISDLNLPGEDGLALSQRALGLDPDLPIVILTGFGTIRSAVEAVKKGIYDYLTKPFDLDQVEVTLRKALEHRDLRRQNRLLRESMARDPEAAGIVGRSAGIRGVLDAVAAVAGTDSTVLVTGESGTGKELVARAIHGAGPRRSKPFVTVDCAAIPAALLESELFGHARGSFTGAYADRAGYFEVALDGTAFLDEIGELEPSTQKKLLRVLEERSFTRVGETRRRQCQARVVAATNRDLAAEVRAGRFREDLFYRLRVIEIRVPPLRERPGDIPLLVSHFLERMNRRLGRNVEAVAPEAMEALQSYPWPGNIRELANVLEQSLTFQPVQVLALRNLPEFVRQSSASPVPQLTYPELKEQVVDSASRSYLEALLTHFQGNVSRVADRAGIDRRHIHRLLQRLGIDPESYRSR